MFAVENIFMYNIFVYNISIFKILLFKVLATYEMKYDDFFNSKCRCSSGAEDIKNVVLGIWH